MMPGLVLDLRASSKLVMVKTLLSIALIVLLSLDFSLRFCSRQRRIRRVEKVAPGEVWSIKRSNPLSGPQRQVWTLPLI